MNPGTALLAALCAFGSLPLFAQDAKPLPDAPVAHRSALDGYRPFTQEEVQPWSQANETVRAAGGWKAYAREIAGARKPSADAPVVAPSSAETPGAVHPHAGHAKP